MKWPGTRLDSDPTKVESEIRDSTWGSLFRPRFRSRKRTVAEIVVATLDAGTVVVGTGVVDDTSAVTAALARVDAGDAYGLATVTGAKTENFGRPVFSNVTGNC